MKPQQKTLTLWIVVILLMALVAKVATVDKTNHKFIKYPEFVHAVEEKISMKLSSRVKIQLWEDLNQGMKAVLALL